MIEIELLLVLIFVGVCFTVHRLTKLLEIGKKILDELKLARPKKPPPAQITEEPLPSPLRLTRTDVEEARAYKP